MIDNYISEVPKGFNKLNKQTELPGVYSGCIRISPWVRGWSYTGYNTHTHTLSCQSHCAVGCKINHTVLGTQKPCFDQCFYLVCCQNAGLSSSSAFVCCSGLVTMHANGGSLSKVSLTFGERDLLVKAIQFASLN